jgi:hypothetical protein
MTTGVTRAAAVDPRVELKQAITQLSTEDTHMSSNVFIPHSELNHDLKICRSTKGKWYSANMWNSSRSEGIPGIEMSEPEILSNLSAALVEVEQIMAELEIAQNRAATLRMFARELYAAPKLKAVAGE